MDEHIRNCEYAKRDINLRYVTSTYFHIYDLVYVVQNYEVFRLFDL